MAKIFGFILVGMLGMLTIYEVVRFIRAGRGEEDLPYPRRRLSRRLAITVLFSAIILLALYWPRTSAPMQLVLLGAVFVSLLLGLVLLWRDLRETSLAVLDHATQMSEEASREFLETLKQTKSAQSKSDSPDKSE